jgi:hypothetical protein
MAAFCSLKIHAFGTINPFLTLQKKLQLRLVPSSSISAGLCWILQFAQSDFQLESSIQHRNNVTSDYM